MGAWFHGAKREPRCGAARARVGVAVQGRSAALAVALVALSGLFLVSACADLAVSRGSGTDRVVAMAQDGDATAQTALGMILERGLGVPQDYERARAWYRKAARQGEPLAEFHLGSLYERGLGVSQDHAEAARWYRRASEKDNDAAQAALAYLYERGLGVEQDYDRARMLYRAAARRWREDNLFPPEAAFALGAERNVIKLARPEIAFGRERPSVEVDLAAIDEAPAPRADPQFDGPSPVAGTGEGFPGWSTALRAPVAAGRSKGAPLVEIRVDVLPVLRPLPSLVQPRMPARTRGTVSARLDTITPASPAAPRKTTSRASPRDVASRAPLFDEVLYDSRWPREAGDALGVSLGSYATKDAATAAWDRLRRTHPSLLGKLGLALRPEPRPGAAPHFVLAAGPLPTTADAQALCAALDGAGAGAPCTPIAVLDR